MISGDRFFRDVGVSDDVVTYVTTLRNVEWFIAAFKSALFTLERAENWETFVVPDDEPFDDVLEDYVGELIESLTILDYVGVVAPFCVADVSDLPEGWLPCRGEQYDAEDYPKLYAKLPSSLKGATTFNTPDLRGHVVMGAGTFPSLTTRNIMDRIGAETHTLTETQIPSHSHTYTPPVANVDLETPGAPDIFAAGVGIPTQTGSTGGGQAHNNIQPSLVMLYAIRAL